MQVGMQHMVYMRYLLIVNVTTNMMQRMFLHTRYSDSPV